LFQTNIIFSYFSKMEIALIVFGSLLIIFTIRPLIRQDHWTFRVFEYPRIQKLALSVLWIILYLIHADFQSTELLVFGILILTNVIYLLTHILPFTPVWKKQVYKTDKIDNKIRLKVIISNVYKNNDDYNG